LDEDLVAFGADWRVVLFFALLAAARVLTRALAFRLSTGAFVLVALFLAMCVLPIESESSRRARGAPAQSRAMT
jgi:hypothetical protein